MSRRLTRGPHHDRLRGINNVVGDKMTEFVREIPLLDEIAVAIKQGGKFARNLTGDELAGIMHGVIAGLLAGTDKVTANISSMEVRIEHKEGHVVGGVSVEKPIKAKIGIDLTLGNGEKPNQLKLVELKVTQEAGFAAKVALGALNIKGKAERVLEDPNKALQQALSAQLEPKGVRLTGVELTFGERALLAKLQGKTVSRQ